MKKKKILTYTTLILTASLFLNSIYASEELENKKLDNISVKQEESEDCGCSKKESHSKEIKKDDIKDNLNIISKNVFDIIDPWVRPANKGANTALYGILENKNKDESLTLIGVEITKNDQEISEEVEIHETIFEDNIARMIHIHNLAIPSNKQVTLKPKATHIMLLGLKDNLNLNDMVKVKFKFLSGQSEIFDVRVTPTLN